MRFAAAQFATDLDKDANTATALGAVRLAADRDAAVVVLPEAAMCGFGKPRTDLTEFAEPLDGPFVTALSGVAAETGLTVVAGMFEPAPGEDRVFNTVAIVGPGGLVASYRKVHLYDALGWCESDRVRAGDPDPANAPVVSLGKLSIGVMTCYDLRFPESGRRLIDQGATVLAVPAAWVAGEHKVTHWRTLLAARAIENTAYVVAAAQPGPTYTGCSMILDPMGVVIGELGPDDGVGSGAVVVAELDADRVDEVRQALPVLKHRRFAPGANPVGPSSPRP